MEIVKNMLANKIGTKGIQFGTTFAAVMGLYILASAFAELAQRL